MTHGNAPASPAFNGLLVRLLGTDLLTIRIDLDPPATGRKPSQRQTNSWEADQIRSAPGQRPAPSPALLAAWREADVHG